MEWAIGGTIVMSLLSFAVYLYYQKNGQFDRSEDLKYQPLREDDDA